MPRRIPKILTLATLIIFLFTTFGYSEFYNLRVPLKSSQLENRQKAIQIHLRSRTHQNRYEILIALLEEDNMNLESAIAILRGLITEYNQENYRGFDKDKIARRILAMQLQEVLNVVTKYKDVTDLTQMKLELKQIIRDWFPETSLLPKEVAISITIADQRANIERRMKMFGFSSANTTFYETLKEKSSNGKLPDGYSEVWDSIMPIAFVAARDVVEFNQICNHVLPKMIDVLCAALPPVVVEKVEGKVSFGYRGANVVTSESGEGEVKGITVDNIRKAFGLQNKYGDFNVETTATGKVTKDRQVLIEVASRLVKANFPSWVLDEFYEYRPTKVINVSYEVDVVTVSFLPPAASLVDKTQEQIGGSI